MPAATVASVSTRHRQGSRRSAGRHHHRAQRRSRQGSDVLRFFPLHLPRRRLLLAPDAVAPRVNARPSRTLLVEDHADSAHALARIIASFGHEVEVAGSIAAALQLFDSKSFDILVSDLGLPDGSGLDLVRQIKAKREMPAIALTGFGMEEDVARCLAAGFGAHLTKPVNFQRLESALAKIVEGV